MSIYVWASEIKNIYVWTTPAKEVYVGATKVRPSWWKPGANTIAYYPLTSTSTVNDQSGNNYNLTNNWSVTFGTQWWVDCATFSWSNYLSRTSSLFTWNPTFTYNVWLRQTSTHSSTENIVAIWSGYSTNSFIMWIKSSWNILYTWWWTNDRDTWYTPPLNTWINLWVTYASNVIRVYINWTQIFSDTLTSFTIPSTSTNIWTWVGWSSSPKFIWNMSNTIFENKQWTATEISDYYNWTKSKYWL
jgi:hypothetical protein